MKLIRRPRLWPIRTSVIVPCAAKHAALLPSLLDELDRQTVHPDEVVIAISGTRSAPTFNRRAYRVHTLIDTGIAFAGRNRNRASDAAIGDVLIYQDADDVPHPQRIEIAKVLFGQFFVEHLIHTYVTSSASPAWRTQRFGADAAVKYAHYEPYSYTYEFHNGNAITTREVFRKVRWPEDIRRGQDVVYNHAVRARFPHRMTRLQIPLLAYRQHLSTTAA